MESLAPDYTSNTTRLAMDSTNTTTGSNAAADMFIRFERDYRHAHGYLATFICVFGIVFNLCNIYVLTRPGMKSLSINTLLTGIAVFDLVTEAAYLPVAIYFHMLTDTSVEYYHPSAWIYFGILSLNTVIVCHNAAMWLTVALATFRYLYVCKHTLAARYCTVKRAYITIAMVTLVSSLLAVPTLICSKVVEKEVRGRTHHWFGKTEWCSENERVLAIFNMLVLGGVVRTTACIVLLGFTSVLIFSLSQVKQRRRTMKLKNGKRDRDHQRMTAMLIGVMLSFVVVELPQGVLATVSSQHPWTRVNVYVNLGDFLDMLVLLNTSVNFVLYAAMSSQFRMTFKDKLVRPIMQSVKANPLAERTESAVEMEKLKGDEEKESGDTAAMHAC